MSTYGCTPNTPQAVSYTHLQVQVGIAGVRMLGDGALGGEDHVGEDVDLADAARDGVAEIVIRQTGAAVQHEGNRDGLADLAQTRDVVQMDGDGDPVSYTHLDVYKRQARSYLQELISAKGKLPRIPYEDLDIALNFCTYGIVGLLLECCDKKKAVDRETMALSLIHI